MHTDKHVYMILKIKIFLKERGREGGADESGIQDTDTTRRSIIFYMETQSLAQVIFVFFFLITQKGKDMIILSF